MSLKLFRLKVVNKSHVIVAFIVIASLILVSSRETAQAAKNSHVSGVNTYLADNNSEKEKPDTVEPTETPEPTDVPEKAQAVEKVQQEINQQVETNNASSVEVQPPQEGSDSGKVILQQQGNTTQELQTPISSTTPVTQMTTPQAGTVSIHVAGSNSITINNGPYTISTQYPVIINPQDQTMAIRTPSGVTVIKTFPTQVFQSVPQQNKLSSVFTLNLIEQQGVPVYQAQGIQVRKFLGIIPVKAQVDEQINAQTGQVINANLPWYFSLFGFVFKST